MCLLTIVVYLSAMVMSKLFCAFLLLISNNVVDLGWVNAHYYQRISM